MSSSRRNTLTSSDKANVPKPLSIEKMQEAKKMFSKFDIEEVGFITKDQLLLLLKDYGHDVETANDLAKNMTFENGKISFNEFFNNLPVIEQQKLTPINEILSANTKKKVSDERMLKARALFSKYDLDGSGSIDRDELEKIFIDLGQKPSEELLQRLDPDGSGNITFMEFVNAFDIWNEILADDDNNKETRYRGSKVKLTQDQMAKARETFSKYDTDGDGQVSSDELFFVLKNLLAELHSDPEAERQARELMDIIDADGDGHITFIEFVKGYELWIQVEEANAQKKVAEDEIRMMRYKINEVTTKKKEFLGATNKLQQELASLELQLTQETEERLKIEKQLWELIADDDMSEDASTTHEMFQHAYDHLNQQSLLNLKSKEFYACMQVFITNSKRKT